MTHHKAGCPSPLYCNCYVIGGDDQRITADNVYDVGEMVLSHQKRADGMHRLVLCTNPPQQAGEWVSCNVWAIVGDYRASWDHGVQGGELVR